MLLQISEEGSEAGDEDSRPTLMSIFKRHIIAYPSDRDLRGMYFETKMWASYKAKLLNEVLTQPASNGTNHFNSTLRGQTPLRLRKRLAHQSSEQNHRYAADTGPKSKKLPALARDPSFDGKLARAAQGAQKALRAIESSEVTRPRVAPLTDRC